MELIGGARIFLEAIRRQDKHPRPAPRPCSAYSLRLSLSAYVIDAIRATRGSVGAAQCQRRGGFPYLNFARRLKSQCYKAVAIGKQSRDSPSRHLVFTLIRG